MGNTYGTHVLLECARVYGGIRRFINVSTDEVYGESSLGKSEGLGEHSVLEPTNPYSAAKAGAEMMAKAYLTSYKLPIIITRGNNVYGPHQFPEKMIPKFTLLASRGRPLPIHGDGLVSLAFVFFAFCVFGARLARSRFFDSHSFPCCCLSHSPHIILNPFKPTQQHQQQQTNTNNNKPTPNKTKQRTGRPLLPVRRGRRRRL